MIVVQNREGWSDWNKDRKESSCTWRIWGYWSRQGTHTIHIDVYVYARL